MFTVVATLIDRVGRSEVGVAIDGALYRFHPLFHGIIMEKIPQFLKQETKVTLINVFYDAIKLNNFSCNLL